MLRQADSPFTRGPLVRAVLVSLVTVNMVLVAITLYGFLASQVGHDWAIFVEAGRRATSGGLYEWDGAYAFSYAPPLAYVFAALTPIGIVGWSVLHVAALTLLRDRWLAIATLVSWPFWVDVYNGNTFVFVFVAAALALRRNQVAIGAYVTLCLLMPRPVMLPVLAWILWREPPWRLRFAAAVAVVGLLVLLTGQAADWLHTLTTVSGAVAVSSRDIGPDVLLGQWWLPIGLVLAILLTIRGHVGLASLAASPYWLPQYLMMGLLELRPADKPTGHVRRDLDRWSGDPRPPEMAEAEPHKTHSHGGDVARGHPARMIPMIQGKAHRHLERANAQPLDKNHELGREQETGF